MIATVKGRRKRNFDQPTGLNFELIFLEISDILFSFRYVLINFSLKQLLSSIVPTQVMCNTVNVICCCGWNSEEIQGCPKNGNRMIIRPFQTAMCWGSSPRPSLLLHDPTELGISGKYTQMQWRRRPNCILTISQKYLELFFSCGW